MLHEKCIGCGHSKLEECNVLADPMAQWTRLGGCAHRTHGLSINGGGSPKVFVDPLKASKAAMKAISKSTKRAAIKTEVKKKERRDSR